MKVRTFAVILAIATVIGALGYLSQPPSFVAPPRTVVSKRMPTKVSMDLLYLDIDNQSGDQLDAVTITATEGDGHDVPYEVEVGTIEPRKSARVNLRDLTTSRGKRFDPLALKLKSVRVSGAIDGEHAESTFSF